MKDCFLFLERLFIQGAGFLQHKISLSKGLRSDCKLSGPPYSIIDLNLNITANIEDQTSVLGDTVPPVRVTKDVSYMLMLVLNWQFQKFHIRRSVDRYPEGGYVICILLNEVTTASPHRSRCGRMLSASSSTPTLTSVH